MKLVRLLVAVKFYLLTMKKLLKNTISIILLVFYLAGFCGFNLLKQHCFGCNQNQFHLIYKAELENSEKHHCHYDNGQIQKCHQITYSSGLESDCCTLEHIYLKNNPTTTIHETCKAPLVFKLDLICHTPLLVHPLFTITLRNVGKNLLQSHHPPKKPAQETLCCFLC